MLMILVNQLMKVGLNWVIIGSGNGLSPFHRQPITGTIGNIFQWNQWNIIWKCIGFHYKYIWKYRLHNGGHFVSALMF